ncbi:MAG TPA: hypothetical protein VIV12_12425 [Streptosporangiaceae bacterium]
MPEPTPTTTPPVVMQQCPTCRGPVIWLSHIQTHQPAPIDAVAVADGNVEIDEAQRTYHVLSVQAAELAHAAGVKLHTRHALTCPGAGARWAYTRATEVSR